jgi:CDGSH-type Zn-finger protein
MKVTVVQNGPLLVETQGEWRYSGAGRSHKKNDRVALCRCGQSGLKPFCDGTHKKVGFEADGGELELTPK